jgi:LuxR family maltose regulon positive regulatory protein
LAHALDDIQVTTVIAPAGYGKTTLISSWLSRIKHPAVAWLTLDAEDGALDRFLTYLSAALAGTESGDRSKLPRFEGPEEAIPYLDRLLSALEKNERNSLLVLENFHLLKEGSDTYELIAYLIAHLPAKLHLVIIARHTPLLNLSRWKLEDRIVNITEDDLAFTRDEIVDFFDKLDTVLSHDKANHILAITKGWPAGLKILSLTDSVHQELKSADDLNYEAKGAIKNYLLEEVFWRLDSVMQQFLLVTGQVSLFSVSLAEGLTGLDREVAGKIVGQLFRENVFIEAAQKSDTEPWFQYHPIFALMLRMQGLQTASVDVPSIMKRASNWFEQSGQFNQAVECAWRIRDYRRIEQLILLNWRVMLMEDNLSMLYRWGKMIPLNVLLGNPILSIVIALPALIEGDVVLSSACTQRAVEYFVDETLPFYAEATTVYSQICALQKRSDEALAAIERAQPLLSEDAYDLRSMLHMSLVIVAKTPNWLTLKTLLLEDLPQALLYGNRTFIANNYAFLSFTEAYTGNFSQARSYIEKALLLPARAARPNRISFMNVYFARMFSAFHQGNSIEAELNLNDYLALLRDSFAAYHISMGYALKASIEFGRDNTEAADVLIAQSIGLSHYGLLMMIMPIRFIEHLAAADVVDVDDFLEDAKRDYGTTFIYRRLTLINGFVHKRFELLPEVRSYAADVQEGWKLEKIHAYLLLALFEEASGNASAAEQALLTSLELAQPEGIIQMFCNDYALVHPVLTRIADRLTTDFARNLLLRISQIDNGEVALVSKESPATLTRRETDIAYLLIAGNSVDEIADRLCISKATVRKHVSNVYNKLEVHSRSQLILRLK